jgi:Tfp pilus assembly protein PilO
MARTISFTKRALITKANSTMVASTSIAVFVVVFCLVASKALMSQAGYQNRVITAKKEAVNQLKTDLNARNSLVSSYKAFVATNQNVLGGNPTGTGDQDGNNAKLVLDALPSNYDFPAMVTTLDKLISSQGLQILNITGTDQEVLQDKAMIGNPSPVTMPFQIQVTGSYQSIQNLTDLFNRSIRPFQLKTIQLAGSESKMTATIAAQTFYQPSKTLNIASKAIK